MYNAAEALAGSRWSGPPMPQSSVPVSNLSPHVSGSNDTGSAGANGTASSTDTQTLHWAAAIVIVAIALLWFLGFVVFKSARA